MFSAHGLLSFLLILSALSNDYRPVIGLQDHNFCTRISRRNALATIFSGTAAVMTPLPGFSADTSTTREQLLSAVSRKDSHEKILEIINNLQDPSGGRAATFPERLDGEWELIWSYKTEAFSPLLKLPAPLRPDSYQYFGSAAAKEVGEGRLAQGLTGGILGTSQIWLSSGAIPFEKDPSVFEIQPPFRYEIGGRYGTGKPKKTIIEAGNDADFRKVNVRNKEAQLAGKNQYRQIYLENMGPGSLRVSSVTAGDPVIVGAVFVHRKL